MNNQNRTSLIERASAWSAVLVLLLLPFVGYGAIRALGVFSNDIKQWLPQGFEESVRYEWFVDSFGLDEMVVVSWPGCTVEDPRLEKLARDLRDAVAADGRRTFSKVITGPEILQAIIDLGEDRDEALKRCRGLFLGPDDKTTCLLAVPEKRLVKNRTVVIDQLTEIATGSIGIEADRVRMGGPTVDGAAIDRESKLALRQFLWMTLVVVFGLTWFRKRSFRLAGIIMAVSGYCAGLSLAILYYTGGTMNLTMIMLPTLVLILGVSASIHMVNYFLKAVATGGRYDPDHGRSAGLRALRSGGWPIFLASATTAIGMGSLGLSQIRPISSFGIYSATGVMASLPVVVLTLVWILNRCTNWLGDRHLKMVVDQNQEVHPGPVIQWLSGITQRFSLSIVAVALLATLAVGWGIRDLKATVKIQNRFAKSSRIIQDYLWLESNIGPLVPMELVVRFPENHPLDAWDRMKAVQYLEKGIRRNEFVNASWSAAMFRPPMPGGNGPFVEAAQRLVKEQWANELGKLEESSLVADSGGEQLWRISVRVAAMNDVDYGQLLDQIKQLLDESVAGLNNTFAKRGQPPISTAVTGAIPMMYKAQHQVFNDLLVSFCTAFGLIALTMMVVLRSFSAGLLAMIPNVMPPLIVFGLMGWWGTRIEIGSVMTASVALGISVDDTIHFLAWYRRGANQTGSRIEGVRRAYAFCSRSMIDTTLICGLGVAPFMMSSFMPTVQFARLMLILLLVALVGDLILLPAMLNGPLGKLFGRLTKKDDPQASGDDVEELRLNEETGVERENGSHAPLQKLRNRSSHDSKAAS